MLRGQFCTPSPSVLLFYTPCEKCPFLLAKLTGPIHALIRLCRTDRYTPDQLLMIDYKSVEERPILQKSPCSMPTSLVVSCFAEGEWNITVFDHVLDLPPH